MPNTNYNSHAVVSFHKSQKGRIRLVLRKFNILWGLPSGQTKPDIEVKEQDKVEMKSAFFSYDKEEN